MKTYRIQVSDDLKRAEAMMNEMAADGWQVKSTAWSPNGLVVTFERDA